MLRLPPGAGPPQGACVPSCCGAGSAAFRMTDHGDLTWEQAMDREIELMAVDRHRRPHGRGIAVQRDVRPAEADD